VLQKCINTMQPESLQFIIDELTQQDGSVVRAAKHRFGSRILRHLLKVCPPHQFSKIAASLLEQAEKLACHSFGNLVLQCLMKFGTERHRYQLARCVEQNVTAICRLGFGGAFIETTMTYAASEDQLWIARACAQDAKVMLALSKTKLGHKGALLVLDTLQGEERRRACANLTQHLENLRSSTCGAHVVQFLEKECDGSCL